MSRNLLSQWDDSLPPARGQGLPARRSRRSFLVDGLSLAAAGRLLPAYLLLPGDAQSAPAKYLQSEPWRTLAAAQEQLFPDDGDGPDARSIHATAYLKFVLEAADMDPRDRQLILGGVAWLNRFAVTKHGAAFARCASADQAWRGSIASP